MIKKIDTKENLKNIAEYKEFYEINLGGGHPNRGLKTFYLMTEKFFLLIFCGMTYIMTKN